MRATNDSWSGVLLGGQVSRRGWIRAGLVGAAGLLLGRQPAARSQGEASAAIKGRAKAVIQVWLWGGASHLDTFDPKPDAGPDYTGPLKSPIATNVDGIRIGELLPELAKHADK